MKLWRCPALLHQPASHLSADFHAVQHDVLTLLSIGHAASGGIKAIICKVLTVSAKFVDNWMHETATAEGLLPGQPTIWVSYLFPCLQPGAEVHRDRDLMQAFDSADKPRKDCNFTSSFRFDAHVQVHFGVDKTGDHFKLEVTSRSQQS